MPDMEKDKSIDIASLGTSSIGRLMWEYSVPAVVGMVVMSLYNVIDRIFIGRGVGSDAIAGLAITFPVMNISAAIGVLIGAGAAARVSIMLGQKDMHGAQMVLGNALTLTIVNAIVYLSLFALFLDDILMAFGASQVTLPYARDFMAYIIPGMFLINVTYNLNSVMRASGYPRRAMYTMFIGAGCNVVLAPIFIFVLDMGIKGAAIATDLSMFVGMIFVVAHFFRPDTSLKFTSGIYALKWRVVLGIIGVGAAPSIINVTGCVINVIVNRTLYAYGGDIAVGAVGIFTTYTSLLCMFVVGLAQGVQPLIGYNYGAGLYARMKRIFWISALVGTFVTAAGSFVSLVFPEWIAKAFTVDADLIAVTSNGFRLSTWMFWAVGFQIIATTLFQSIGKAGQSIFLSLIRQVIFLVPLLLILPHFMELDGVWFSYPFSDMCATVVTVVMVAVQMRKINKIPQQPSCG